MPAITATVTCPIHDSFRVQQVAGMFDLQLGAKSTERFEVDVPGLRENWQIGLIVGPPRSGKTTVARRAFRDALYSGADWPNRRAVVDCFGDLSIRQVIELFTAVGFSSPPSWVKPYRVLSNGEKFRCDLARALSAGFQGASNEERGSRKNNSPLAPQSSPLVLFDEFTSVVDRNVAKVASAAIAKGIRSGSIPCRFVAVTCHYDVAAWLAPDWIVDMATCDLLRTAPGFAGGRFRRPDINLEIRRCNLDAWRMFERHHYLTGKLPTGARCYLTTWEGTPVNFCATVPLVAKTNHRRFTRIVTLPDYQGIGIGMRAAAAVGELHRAEGLRINVTSSHPALIRHCERSPQWKLIDIRKSSVPRRSARFATYRNAAGRTVVSFEYIGDA
jgi:hypothetical protein